MICDNISLCTIPAILIGYLIKYILKIHGKKTFVFYHHEKDPFIFLELIKETKSRNKKYFLFLILIVYIFTIALFIKGVFNSIENVTYIK